MECQAFEINSRKDLKEIYWVQILIMQVYNMWRSGLNIRYKNIPKLSQVNIFWIIKRDCMADFYNKFILKVSSLEKRGLVNNMGNING